VNTSSTRTSSTASDEGWLNIAATFTAQPVLPSLGFWLDHCHLLPRRRILPYNQVFQHLLDPDSPIRNNPGGANVLLLRLSDMLPTESAAGGLEARTRTLVEELCAALRQALPTARCPWSVVVCPLDPRNTSADLLQAALSFEHELAGRLRTEPEIGVTAARTLAPRYRVERRFDIDSDRVAAIPYTEQFFTALGTEIARQAFVHRGHLIKAVVVDCDDTLWQGRCGEPGPSPLVVTEPHRRFQKLLLEQRNCGRLLAICSRNHPGDVQAAFADLPGMLLKPDDFAVHRINWQHKADSLSQIGAELDVDLGSMVFFDDDPRECAAVEAVLPEVAAFPVPVDPDGLQWFVQHLWLLDHTYVTREDRARSGYYAVASRREAVRRHSHDLVAFLRSLRLQVRVRPPSSQEDGRRAEQLSQRVTQFNLTGRRLAVSDVLDPGGSGDTSCWIVDADDRFGDYGTVGIMRCRYAPEGAEVTDFLLSCRALGRGVEYRMAAALARESLSREIGTIDVRCSRTDRNAPAQQFIANLAARCGVTVDEQGSVRLDAESLSRAEPAWAVAPGAARDKDRSAETPRHHAAGTTGREVHRRGTVGELRRLAIEWRSVDGILAAVRRASTVAAPDPPVESRNGTDTEARLKALWASLLMAGPLRTSDSWFDLGGESMQLLELVSRVRAEFNVRLPLASVLIPNLTIDYLAGAVDQLRGEAEKR
jgi:FkbH-like protein